MEGLSYGALRGGKCIPSINWRGIIFPLALPQDSNNIIKTYTVNDGPIDSQVATNGKWVYRPAARTGLFILNPDTGEEIKAIDYSGVILNSLRMAGNLPPNAPQTIQVLSPQPSETIQRGKPFTIKWDTDINGIAAIRQQVELSTDGGQTFSFIANADNLLGQTSEFQWNVPPQIISNAQLRITATNLYFSKSSTVSGTFSIADAPPPPPPDTQAPTVKFLNPLGGETFTTGDNIMVTWSSSDNVGVTSQSLALSTDGGASFPLTIANGLTGSTQSFIYQLPATLQTNTARLRLIVRDAAGNSAQAITPANFTVQAPPMMDTQAPTVTISKPTGETFAAGQPLTVNWQSVDNVGVVSQELLLSLDGGTTFQTLASFDGSTGIFIINNLADYLTDL